jgi:hypothetical protein
MKNFMLTSRTQTAVSGNDYTAPGTQTRPAVLQAIAQWRTMSSGDAMIRTSGRRMQRVGEFRPNE